MKQKKNVTIYDIADEMNVSSGTVYRALHNTGRISQETRRRVLETAERMGYSTNVAAQGLRRKPIYIGCLLCCPVISFLQEVRRGVDAAFEALAPFRVFPDIREIGDNVDDHDEQIRQIFQEFAENQCKGVLLFLSGKNSRYGELVQKLEASGVPVAVVVSDIPESGRSVCVSVDGICAGMLAAEILNLSCTQKRVAILTGNKDISINKANVLGFYEYAKTHPFAQIDVFEHQDLSQRALEQLSVILSKQEYDGLYISTACSIYLYEYQKMAQIPPHMRIVTTDLFEENRILLQEEIACATIFQDPYLQGRRAVEMLNQRINGTLEKGEYMLTPQLVMRSNRELFSSASPGRDKL